MNVRPTILQVFEEIAVEGDKQLSDGFEDATVLLESGLDSLDFAIAVARLEDEFGEDPFTAMEEPIYPVTLGDFVSVYESYFSRAA